MKFPAKTQKTGDSMMITIPKQVREHLGINFGDIIQIDVNKYDEVSETFMVACPKCKLHITVTSQETVIDCPRCNTEGIRTYKLEKIYKD